MAAARAAFCGIESPSRWINCAKDRVTMLPESLKPPLQEHLKRVKAVHERDLAEGWGRVQLPMALDRKYPNAPKDWRWQWVFPQEGRWNNTNGDVRGDIMLTNPWFRKPSWMGPQGWDSASGPLSRDSGIPSQRTFSKAATIFEPSRNSEGRVMSRRP